MNIGVIGCPLSDEFFTAAQANGQALKIRKVYYDLGDATHKAYLNGDILHVETVESIINDEEIEMIVLSGKQKSLAGQVLNAGKAVRVL